MSWNGGGGQLDKKRLTRFPDDSTTSTVTATAFFLFFSFLFFFFFFCARATDSMLSRDPNAVVVVVSWCLERSQPLGVTSGLWIRLQLTMESHVERSVPSNVER